MPGAASFQHLAAQFLGLRVTVRAQVFREAAIIAQVVKCGREVGPVIDHLDEGVEPAADLLEFGGPMKDRFAMRGPQGKGCVPAMNYPSRLTGEVASKRSARG